MTADTQLVLVDGKKKAEPSQLEKWGDACDDGFQIVPNILFRSQAQLRIDAVDVVILLNLSLHWRGGDSLPFPSPALLAQRMGVDRRTIERRISALQKKGFVKRLAPAVMAEGKPKVRRFVMDGLVAKLGNVVRTKRSQREYVQRGRLDATTTTRSPGSSDG